MSTPEDRTRRLDPALPPPPPPERLPPVEPAGPDRIALLADDLRSLRTALIVVGVLALAGLALGVYSLLDNESSDNARGDQRERIQRLDRRVDDVEEDQRRASEESDVAALERRLERVRRDARTAERNATTAAEANDQLRGRISDLAETNSELADRLQALEDSGGGDGGGGDAGADAP